MYNGNDKESSLLIVIIIITVIHLFFAKMKPHCNINYKEYPIGLIHNGHINNDQIIN